MKLGLTLSSWVVLSHMLGDCRALAPSLHRVSFLTTHPVRPSHTCRNMIFDPSSLQDLVHLPSTLLADAVDSVTAAVETTVPAVASPDAAAAAANSGNGGFGFLTEPIQFLVTAFHSILVSMGMSADAWGISIITMTLFIKLVTYPLTKSQLESTTKMQSLQPVIKDIQTKYQSNPDVMNQKIAEVYQTNQINPLAGCLPAIVQIPIFIGLYRAVLNLAKEDKLDEPFLWLPNLEGPVYGADPAHGTDWLFQNWQNGVPSLGWENTLAFLSLPVLLILSQYVSMALVTPSNKDQEQPVILKFLPIMVGWFSLNVPAALGIYWVVNNIVTTLLTLQIRSTLATHTGGGGTMDKTAVVVDTQPISFTPAPMREKPMGFGLDTTVGKKDEMKIITTSPIEEEDEDDSDDRMESTTAENDGKTKKRGGKKKRKN